MNDVPSFTTSRSPLGDNEEWSCSCGHLLPLNVESPLWPDIAELAFLQQYRCASWDGQSVESETSSRETSANV